MGIPFLWIAVPIAAKALRCFRDQLKPSLPSKSDSLEVRRVGTVQAALDIRPFDLVENGSGCLSVVFMPC